MLLKKSQLIFIIGSGRSGTNYLGRIIGKHPKVRMFLEDHRTFKKSIEVNVEDYGNKAKYHALRKTYKSLQRWTKQPYILEKSHTNIWIVEQLMHDFPEAKFVGITRDPYQTVYSMVNHKGVKRWFDKLAGKKESHFLGINKGNQEQWPALPVESKCAIRWYAHHKRLETLKEKYPDKVIVLEYNDLVQQFSQQVSKLSDFTGLDLMTYAEMPRFQPLNKWRNFSETALSNIKETLAKEEQNPHYFV